jgi:hypothetical protein
MTDVYYLIVSPPWIGLEGRYEKGARVDTYTRMLAIQVPSELTPPSIVESDGG